MSQREKGRSGRDSPPRFRSTRKKRRKEDKDERKVQSLVRNTFFRTEGSAIEEGKGGHVMCLIRPLLGGKEGGGRDDAVRSSPCHGYHPGQVPGDLISLKTKVWRNRPQAPAVGTQDTTARQVQMLRVEGRCVCACVLATLPIRTVV